MPPSPSTGRSRISDGRSSGGDWPHYGQEGRKRCALGGRMLVVAEASQVLLRKNIPTHKSNGADRQNCLSGIEYGYSTLRFRKDFGARYVP